jgi:tRNA uridine 5-carbamoylmethylation protein Kti12
MIEAHENIIVIIGDPATGKTHLTNHLALKYPEHRVIHTDDYQHHGFQKSLYMMMDDIAASPNKKMIIEGIQSARLLRKGVQLNNFHPDLIIETTAPDDLKLSRYAQRAKEYPHALVKNLRTVMNEYQMSLRTSPVNMRMPRIIQWDSSIPL